MDQMRLFPLGEGPAKANGPEPVPIRSGRIGPIRFGATEASYAMVRSVLVALADLPGHAGENPDR